MGFSELIIRVDDLYLVIIFHAESHTGNEIINEEGKLLMQIMNSMGILSTIV